MFMTRRPFAVRTARRIARRIASRAGIASVAALAVLVANTAPAVAQEAEAKAEIASAIAKFQSAYNRADIAGVVALYAEDGMTLPPGADARVGRAEIQAAWEEDYVEDSVLTLRSRDVQVHGDIAIEVGGWKIDMKDGTHVDHGDYLAVWTKTAEGWRMSHDIWNSNMAQ